MFGRYIACRDSKRCEEAAEEIRKITQKEDTNHSVQLDLASLDSIKGFATVTLQYKLYADTFLEVIRLKAAAPFSHQQRWCDGLP